MMADQQRFRKILLDNRLQPQLWKSSAMSLILKKWKESPKTVVICDIEGTNMGGLTLSPLNIFEIALRNADGGWIIKPTIIHHQISKQDLYTHNAPFLKYDNGLIKFYGEIDATEAKGVGSRTATWKAIGQELEIYVKKNGKLDTWLEWSSTSCDWKGIYAGLASVGYDHLMPPKSPLGHSPMIWWRKVRKIFAADLKGLKLTQGNLFQVLFPEDTNLLSRAHYAGADVQMLSKVLQYTFADGSHIKGKIKSHFSFVNLDLSELGDGDFEDCEEDDVSIEDDESNEDARNFEGTDYDSDSENDSDNLSDLDVEQLAGRKHEQAESQEEAEPRRKRVRQ